MLGGQLISNETHHMVPLGVLALDDQTGELWISRCNKTVQLAIATEKTTWSMRNLRLYE